ncbi:hypothetical protein LCGC14_1099870 [marine sediment metagenome]|uniref:Uncharacterized protein n=1 Tax=marine sediment metagenome TaxID=412755 RepID=A0A0F9M9U8_9ZZZZ
MIELFYTIGVVLAVISIPVIIIGMCKYGWFDKDPAFMMLGMVGVPVHCLLWFIIIPLALALGLLYLICKGLIALCPNK